MNYIVLDLEWNQSAHGKEAENEKVPFEIIEIGAIKLDQNLKMTGEFSEIIAPQIYHEMNRITKELVHLDMEDLKEGRAFPEVMEDFLKWCGQDYIFCIWGMTDLVELQRNMSYYKMKHRFAFPLKYLDVQKLFSIAYEDRKSRRSLEYAIDYLKLEKAEDFHRAKSDAYYTAKIMQTLTKEIFRNYSIDYYRTPKSRKDEIYAIFDTYSKYISKEFTIKEKVMQDREVSSTRCYLCGKPAKKKIRWFSNGNKMYYCLAKCDNHGYLKGKIRLKKAVNGNAFAVKTLKLVGAEEAKAIKERQETMRERKKRKKLTE